MLTDLTATASEDHLSNMNMQMNQPNNAYSAFLESQQSSKQSSTRKTVTFAQYSEQYVFICSSYRSKHSYRRSDIRLMKDQVVKDASRIYNLISRHSQAQNGISSIISLGVQPEELIGLEHLIGPESAMGRTRNRRRVHQDVVLRAQEAFRKEALSREIAALKLAEAASASSSRHVMKARNKAKMSLQAKRRSPANMSSCLSRVEKSASEIMTTHKAVVNRGNNAASKARKTVAIAA